VIGDVHGCRDALLGLLEDAGLADRAGRWSGAEARLWLLGDLVDRGPDGIGAVDLVRALQRQGDVRCLLGNHELLLLAAWRFGDTPAGGPGGTFRAQWLANGGRHGDLERLTADHASWIAELPALAREGDTLLLHCDSDRYLRHGSSVREVVTAVARIVSGDDPAAIDELLADASDRFAFVERGAAERVLAVLGGRRIVHGHTPLALLLGRPAHEVTAPLVTHDGLCVNVDHGLFLGGPGFVMELDRLPRLPEPPVAS
jgi:hypothetical protein